MSTRRWYNICMYGILAGIFIYLLIDSTAVIYMTNDYSEKRLDVVDSWARSLRKLALLQFTVSALGILGILWQAGSLQWLLGI